MANIRIVQTPQGDAPLWVREAWIGLEIPVIGQTDPDTPQFSATGGPATPENIDGYEVHGSDALLALQQAGRAKAADWWRNDSVLRDNHLIFSKDACVLIQNGYEQERLHFIMGPNTAHPFMRFVLQISFARKKDSSGISFLPGILNPLPTELTLAKEHAGTVELMHDPAEAFVPEGTWCLISDGSNQYKLFLPETVIEDRHVVLRYASFMRIPNGSSPGFIDPDIQRVVSGDNGFRN